MPTKLVSGAKIAETSSKGNQEKWYDEAAGYWYKLDQFGYEALAETLISILLAKSNIKSDTPFSFVRYRMEKLHVHGRERSGCVSRSFLSPGQSLITVNRLLTNHLGIPLAKKLAQLSSDKKRLGFLAQATAEFTGLKEFPEYLTILFEIDALFCNDDRHLNNIAVIEREGAYSFCPIFDNGAGLLSDTQTARMDISPKALLAALRARPLGTTFNRQIKTAQSLYGKRLLMPKLSATEIASELEPLLEFYAQRDRAIIADRVTQCIVQRQREM